jgi:hypothetical protein
MEQRWYDHEPLCTRLLAQIRGMPQEESREFCARVLIHFSEKLRKDIQDKEKKALKVNSIGLSAIASWYRFGSYKRRWYDNQAILHKAIGSLYALPVPGLAAISFKLGDTFGLLQVYALVCRELEQAPVLAEMAKICMTSLQDGPEEAREILIAIVGEELFESLSLQAQAR